MNPMKNRSKKIQKYFIRIFLYKTTMNREKSCEYVQPDLGSKTENHPVVWSPPLRFVPQLHIWSAESPSFPTSTSYCHVLYWASEHNPFSFQRHILCTFQFARTVTQKQYSPAGANRFRELSKGNNSHAACWNTQGPHKKQSLSINPKSVPKGSVSVHTRYVLKHKLHLQLAFLNWDHSRTLTLCFSCHLPWEKSFSLLPMEFFSTWSNSRHWWEAGEEMISGLRMLGSKGHQPMRRYGQHLAANYIKNIYGLPGYAKHIPILAFRI